MAPLRWLVSGYIKQITDPSHLTSTRPLNCRTREREKLKTDRAELQTPYSTAQYWRLRERARTPQRAAGDWGPSQPHLMLSGGPPPTSLDPSPLDPDSENSLSPQLA